MAARYHNLILVGSSQVHLKCCNHCLSQRTRAWIWWQCAMHRTLFWQFWVRRRSSGSCTPQTPLHSPGYAWTAGTAPPAPASLLFRGLPPGWTRFRTVRRWRRLPRTTLSWRSASADSESCCRAALLGVLICMLIDAGSRTLCSTCAFKLLLRRRQFGSLMSLLTDALFSVRC